MKIVVLEEELCKNGVEFNWYRSYILIRGINMEPEQSLIETKKEKPYLYGFGGWLYLFAAGIIFQFYGTVTSLNKTYKLFTSDDFAQLTTIGSQSYNSLWKPTILFEMASQIISLLLMLSIAFFCIKLSPYFKYLSITFISFILVANSIDLFLMLSIQNGYADDLFGGDDVYKQVTKSIGYAIVWIPYMLLSKRVKNTYNTASSVTYGKEKLKISTFFSGVLAFVVGSLLILNYIALAVIYFWSSYLGYTQNGFWGTILTLFIPVIAQIYWLYHEWSTQGNMSYVFLCLITVCSYIIIFATYGIFSKKLK